MILAVPYKGFSAHMSRKFKKGYFVQGQFVAEGSELDFELKRELKGGSDEPSRTDLKKRVTNSKSWEKAYWICAKTSWPK